MVVINRYPAKRHSHDQNILLAGSAHCKRIEGIWTEGLGCQLRPGSTRPLRTPGGRSPCFRVRSRFAPRTHPDPCVRSDRICARQHAAVTGRVSFPQWDDQSRAGSPWDAIPWMQFATILPFCLRWLSRHYLLRGILGAIGGPLAFYTGERLGAVDFLEPRLLHFAILGTVPCA